jgi:PleD family two-component response regulator
MSNRQERRYRKIAHSLQKVQELMKKDGLTGSRAYEERRAY